MLTGESYRRGRPGRRGHRGTPTDGGRAGREAEGSAPTRTRPHGRSGPTTRRQGRRLQRLANESLVRVSYPVVHSARGSPRSLRIGGPAPASRPVHGPRSRTGIRVHVRHGMADPRSRSRGTGRGAQLGVMTRAPRSVESHQPRRHDRPDNDGRQPSPRAGCVVATVPVDGGDEAQLLPRGR